MSRSGPAVRQIRPRAAMLTVPEPGHDDVVQQPHLDLLEEILRTARQTHVAEAGFLHPDGWLWYAMTAAAL